MTVPKNFCIRCGLKLEAKVITCESCSAQVQAEQQSLIDHAHYCSWHGQKKNCRGSMTWTHESDLSLDTALPPAFFPV
jgi:hypothetical protein